MLGLRTGPGRVVMGPMRRPQDTTQFDAVDLAPDVAYLVRFLETAKQVPGFRQAKDEMLAAMRLRPGMCVLEGAVAWARTPWSWPPGWRRPVGWWPSTS